MRKRRHRNFALRAGIVPALLFGALRVIPAGPAKTSVQDEPPFKLRAETRVVQIDVSVWDPRGQPVEDLKQSDFRVTDNGRPRPFTMFSFNSGKAFRAPSGPFTPQSGDPEAPLGTPALPPNVFTNVRNSSRSPEAHSTIILLDGINGWFDNFSFARESVVGLLNKTPTGERIAVYALLKGVGMVVLQDYTQDRAKLGAAVTKVIPRGMPPAPPHMPEGSEGMMEDPAPGTRPVRTEPWHASAGEKELALRLASEDVRRSLNALAETLKRLPGRKSVFWVTQGFPPSQIRNGGDIWDKTIANLNDANIEVNTVDSNGLGGPPRFWGPGAIRTLQEVAGKTGGQAYYYRNDLDTAMASRIAQSRSSYTLGFYLTQPDDRYHELKVQVTRPGLQLSYRRGYYAHSEAVRDGMGTKSVPLEAALLNPSGFAGVKITAAIEIAAGRPRATITARLRLDPEALTIKKTRDGYTGKVNELFIELNTEGREVGRFSDTKEFTILGSDKPRFDSRGVNLIRAIPLVAGAVKGVGSRAGHGNRTYGFARDSPGPHTAALGFLPGRQGRRHSSEPFSSTAPGCSPLSRSPARFRAAVH